MMMRRFGIAVLAMTSLFGLSTTLSARDWDDRYRGWNNYGGLSAHQRHEIQERRERELRDERRRLDFERRRADQYRYNNNNRYRQSNGSYDRFGNWHPNVW